MVRKLSFLFFVGLLSLGISFAAVAKTTTVTMKGTVDKIDMATKTLSVNVNGTAKNLTFNDKSYIYEGKTRVKVAQLKTGDEISIIADSHNYVRRADIQQASAATPPDSKP